MNHDLRFQSPLNSRPHLGAARAAFGLAAIAISATVLGGTLGLFQMQSIDVQQSIARAHAPASPVRGTLVARNVRDGKGT